MFVMHVVALKAFLAEIFIHLSREAQIAALN